MSVIHVPEERPLQPRILLVPGLLIAVMLAYVSRLWYLQVVEYDDLKERASVTNNDSVERLAPRGKIVDRTGQLIAGVKPTVVILARPVVALKHPDVVARVARMLGSTASALTKAIYAVRGKGNLAVPVYVGADVVVATKIAEIADELPGFSVDTQAMRYYAQPLLTSHITGYVGTPRDVDKKRLESQGIDPAGYVGIQGIEREYERSLMGIPGHEKFAIDARQRKLRSLSIGTEEPVAGSTLILSLDLKLQAVAQNLLSGRRGSVVALDPTTGEVLVLASSPTYDASDFLQGISRDEYSALQNDPSRPFFFRATSAAYPPGSTFKVLTTIASWITNEFSTTATFNCPGYLQVGNHKTKCLGVHGDVSYDRAFSKSCNTYFGHLAELIGREGLLKACEATGIGKATGIDLPSESAGRVPTPEWWAQNRDRPWSIGDTVNFGIGQGELAVTPLQMACLVALVANRGTSYKPHLLRATVGPEEGAQPVFAKPEPLGHVDATAFEWDSLTSAMRHVIESGTARTAQIPGLSWGGKTGSAENRKDHETHSWFVGMAPIDNPKIVICVMVENAGHGGEVAAPIAAQVVRAWLQSKNPGTPQVEVHSTSNLDTASSTQDSPAESPN